MRMMRLVVLALCASMLMGCAGQTDSSALLQEGVVYTMQWTDGAGKTHGMSRLQMAESVPGGNGSWNMNLYARLYATHVEIVNRDTKDLGPQVIPIERIDFIQFGEGGRVLPNSK